MPQPTTTTFPPAKYKHPSFYLDVLDSTCTTLNSPISERLSKTTVHIHSQTPPSFSFVLLVLSFSIQVPAKTDCVMCFGPVVSDGYGVCYNPMEKHINFAVSAFNSCADTSATRLAHALEDALLDMKSLLDQTLKSKL